MGDLPPSLVVATACALGLGLVGPLARWVLRRRGRTAFAADLAGIRWPVRAAAVSLVVLVAGESQDWGWMTALGVGLLVSAIAWLLLRAMLVVQAVMFRRLHVDVTDNLRARSRRTQIELLRRLAAVVIVLVTAVVLLLTLSPFASFGPAVVAYAGLIGVVLGIALRSPLENLAAGIAVALTEPVRLDDVVVVEGEWGRIEEIGLLNIVVRIWDDRRLVLPTSRFVQEPFENWTRESSEVLGSVTLWVDHSTDVDAVRAAVGEILERAPLFDGRAQVVQVVEIGPHAVQLRVLVTARNAQDCWDLRCQVREELLDHLQRRPGTLPVLRLDR